MTTSMLDVKVHGTYSKDANASTTFRKRIHTFSNRRKIVFLVEILVTNRPSNGSCFCTRQDKVAAGSDRGGAHTPSMEIARNLYDYPACTVEEESDDGNQQGAAIPIS